MISTRQIDQAELARVLSPLFEKNCCRQHIGASGSLSIGFGDKLAHNNPRILDPYYGEWEIGTYYGSWRIIQEQEIILSNRDIFDSEEELQQRLDSVVIDKIVSVETTSKFDIRIRFRNKLILDVLDTSSEDDELFHIFGPLNIFIEYSARHGWKLGKSDEPWK